MIQSSPGYERQANRFVWSFVIVGSLALIVIGRDALLPTYDYCKNMDPYSTLWFLMGCWVNAG